MTIFERPPRYRSYLLTFWEERSQDSATPAEWRFSLEDPRPGSGVAWPAWRRWSSFCGQNWSVKRTSYPIEVECRPAREGVMAEIKLTTVKADLTGCRSEMENPVPIRPKLNGGNIVEVWEEQSTSL